MDDDERRRRRADQRRRVQRRRLLAGLIAGGAAIGFVAGVVIAASDGGSDGATAARGPEKPKLAELPRGGRTIFPAYRVVAYYGAPQSEELGALGIGTPTAAGRRLIRAAKPYARKTRPVLPAMELIATIAQAAPGPADMYRLRQPAGTIRRYLEAARRIKALLILDIQPGHAEFMDEARALERWLREPDVGLALDPEWHTPGAVPGKQIGSTDAATVNEVSRWLAGIVRRHKLPEKLLLVHQFTEPMIANRDQLAPQPGVPLVVNVDGFANRALKIARYHDLALRRDRLRDGIKLFYHEDTNLLSPGAVMDLLPRPDLVVYE